MPLSCIAGVVRRLVASLKQKRPYISGRGFCGGNAADTPDVLADAAGYRCICCFEIGVFLLRVFLVPRGKAQPQDEEAEE